MVRVQVLALESFLIKVPPSVDNNPDGRLEIFGLDNNLDARLDNTKQWLE